MAKNLKPNPENYIRPASGDCNPTGNRLVFDYSAYPFLANAWPVQPPVSFNAQQKAPCPPNDIWRADTRRQQRVPVYGARGSESLQSTYQTAPSRGPQTAATTAATAAATAAAPPASQYEQFRQSPQQLQQMRQHLHQFQQQQQNWSMGNFTNAYNSQMGQLNHYTPLSPSEAQIWPGYYMISSPDPNVPFGFGLGPLDIN